MTLAFRIYPEAAIAIEHDWLIGAVEDAFGAAVKFR